MSKSDKSVCGSKTLTFISQDDKVVNAECYVCGQKVILDKHLYTKTQLNTALNLMSEYKDFAKYVETKT